MENYYNEDDFSPNEGKGIAVIILILFAFCLVIGVNAALWIIGNLF